VTTKPADRCARVGCFCATVASTMPAPQHARPIEDVFCAKHLQRFTIDVRYFALTKSWPR